MVGQLLLEDEYIINVKVRRPIDDSCPPPPTFTVACHDGSQKSTTYINPNDMENLPSSSHQSKPFMINSGSKLALPSSGGYIGAFTVGPNDPGESVPLRPRSRSPKPLEWKGPVPPVKEGEDLTKREMSVTMRPGSRTVLGGHGPPLLLDTTEQCDLPQVKVYGDDENLLATNVFKAPPKPTQRGTLYVERIAEHCKSTSGELYVPPVLEDKLKEKKDETPMAGNSKRTEQDRLNAKLRKKSYTPIILKVPEPSTHIARDHLTDVLENKITSADSRLMLCNKPTYAGIPSVANTPLHRERRTSPTTPRPLTFPVPTPCIQHSCPRSGELDTAVHLSQSATLFPHNPSAMPTPQSFNYPPSRSGSSSQLENSDFTDCEPCFSTVYSAASSNRPSRSQTPVVDGPNNSQIFSGGSSLCSVEDSPAPYRKPAFFQAPSSLRSRSSSLKDTLVHPNQESPRGVQGKIANFQNRIDVHKSKFPLPKAHDIQYSASDNQIFPHPRHECLDHRRCEVFEQSNSDGEYTHASHVPHPCCGPFVSRDNSPYRNCLSHLLTHPCHPCHPPIHTQSLRNDNHSYQSHPPRPSCEDGSKRVLWAKHPHSRSSPQHFHGAEKNGVKQLPAPPTRKSPSILRFYRRDDEEEGAKCIRTAENASVFQGQRGGQQGNSFSGARSADSDIYSEPTNPTSSLSSSRKHTGLHGKSFSGAYSAYNDRCAETKIHPKNTSPFQGNREGHHGKSFSGTYSPYEERCSDTENHLRNSSPFRGSRGGHHGKSFSGAYSSQVEKGAESKSYHQNDIPPSRRFRGSHHEKYVSGTHSPYDERCAEAKNYSQNTFGGYRGCEDQKSLSEAYSTFEDTCTETEDESYDEWSSDPGRVTEEDTPMRRHSPRWGALYGDRSQLPSGRYPFEDRLQARGHPAPSPPPRRGERAGDVYSGVNPTIGGTLTSQPHPRPEHSLHHQLPSTSAHQPTLAHETLQQRSAGSQSGARMLVTEQQSSMGRGLPPHDHNHNTSLGDKDTDELDNRHEGYLFPENSFNDVTSYDTVDRKSNATAAFTPSPPNHIKKLFPNGFPNFNNFRNNPQGFYDNLCYDAGYASERSPEEEDLPVPFDIETLDSSRETTSTPDAVRDQEDEEDEEQQSQEQSIVLQLIIQGVDITTQTLMDVYPFINEGTMFDVTVEKNSRGLGLSLCGGCETKGPYAGLLRIKKLYPQMPAWLCGQLRQGDIVLEANQLVLSGLASHEALEVLRTTKTSGVHLLVCRPPLGTLDDPCSSSPIPDQSFSQDIVSSSMMGVPLASPRHLAPSPVQSLCGEFEINLTKVNGSLGFTLRKRDNSVLGHTIRTLVREPALSDGRIKPGDKILSVNSTDLCGLSHEEAIAFLRTTPETVAIRLYRDVTQTPVSPLSPSEPEDSLLKPKPLRQEARDMLSDLAFRKRASPSMSPASGASGGHSASPGNPRRRRLQKTPTPDVAKAVVVDRFDSLVRKIEETPEGSELGEAEEPAFLNLLRPDREPSPLSNRGSYASSISRESALISRNTSNASNDTNSLSESSETRRKRPSFLDLDNRQSCPRKTQFTPPHEMGGSFPSPLSSSDYQFLSMGSVDSAPPLASAHSVSPSFAHLQPAYQSVNFGNLQHQANEHNRLTGTTSDYTISGYSALDDNNTQTPHQKSGLLKWKGMMMAPEEEESTCHNSNDSASENRQDRSENLDGQRSHRMKEVTINLQRGWNSRLGFSLQAEGGATKVVAIYAGCVAAKDGRLRIGDQVLKVNGEDVTSWETEKVIDLLRKTHGKIDLTVLQQPF